MPVSREVFLFYRISISHDAESLATITKEDIERYSAVATNECNLVGIENGKLGGFYIIPDPLSPCYLVIRHVIELPPDSIRIYVDLATGEGSVETPENKSSGVSITGAVKRLAYVSGGAMEVAGGLALASTFPKQGNSSGLGMKLAAQGAKSIFDGVNPYVPIKAENFVSGLAGACVEEGVCRVNYGKKLGDFGRVMESGVIGGARTGAERLTYLCVKEHNTLPTFAFTIAEDVFTKVAWGFVSSAGYESVSIAFEKMQIDKDTDPQRDPDGADAGAKCSGNEEKGKAGTTKAATEETGVQSSTVSVDRNCPEKVEKSSESDSLGSTKKVSGDEAEKHAETESSSSNNAKGESPATSVDAEPSKNEEKKPSQWEKVKVEAGGAWDEWRCEQVEMITKSALNEFKNYILTNMPHFIHCFTKST